MFHCSAAEGQKFQKEITRISKIIEDLGSNPLKESQSTERKEAASKKGKTKK